jgi:hypothetical protein
LPCYYAHLDKTTPERVNLTIFYWVVHVSNNEIDAVIYTFGEGSNITIAKAETPELKKNMLVEFFAAYSSANICVTNNNWSMKWNQLVSMAETLGVEIPSIDHVENLNIIDCIKRVYPGIKEEFIVKYVSHISQNVQQSRPTATSGYEDDYESSVNIKLDTCYIYYKNIFAYLILCGKVFIKVALVLYLKYNIPIAESYTSDYSETIMIYSGYKKTYVRQLPNNEYTIQLAGFGNIINKIIYAYNIYDWVYAGSINHNIPHIFDSVEYRFLQGELTLGYKDYEIERVIGYIGTYNGLVFADRKLPTFTELYIFDGMFICRDKSWIGKMGTNIVAYDGCIATEMLSCDVMKSAFISYMTNSSVLTMSKRCEDYQIKISVSRQNCRHYKAYLTREQIDYFNRGEEPPITIVLYWGENHTVTNDPNSMCIETYTSVLSRYYSKSPINMNI